MFMFRYKLFKATPFFLLSLLLLDGSCGRHKDFNLQANHDSLKLKAESINHDFMLIRLEVDSLAATVKDLYERKSEILPGIERSKYILTANGILTKPVNDGGSAVFVTGYYPIDEEVKEVVYFTEPVDPEFRRLVSEYPEIVQVYFNDSHAVNRIYPFFDVLSQYEAKMDIPSFNFYFLADAKHNPGRKSLWVSEPYVDPAGRGWMVSAIAPVYYKEVLVGVAGIDVTINRITKRYIPAEKTSMTMIIDNSGAIVAAEETAINFLSFPPLQDHQYVETIKQDTYRKETYNLALSKNEQVRDLGLQILANKDFTLETELNGEPVAVVAAYVPELNWHILEILQ